MKPATKKLLDAVITTGAGATNYMSDATAAAAPGSPKTTYHGVVAGTGAVAATVNVEVSNNGTTWLVAGTITLSGTTTAQDGFALDAPWLYVRGNCTAISGTGAALTLTQGVV